jgi:hypothetical protein
MAEGILRNYLGGFAIIKLKIVAALAFAGLHVRGS